MNDLIGNNNEPTQEQLNAKKWMKIIGVILVLLLLVCIALIVLMYYIQSSQLKVSIDGKANSNLQNILVIEGDKVYVPIRQFAEFVGYESYSGDYKQYKEDTTKCYVQSSNEIASFSLDSDKIYKLLTNGNDYEYFTIDEPVKMINGVLYTTMSGAEKAFNISFGYNKQTNQITIYTLPYLVTSYAAKFTNSAIAGEEASFSNQKALLYNMIIVKNSENYYGVYDLTGKEILGTKYSSIEFIESTKEFIVTTEEKKMGIISYNAETKISPEYDEIKQIDKDAGLYLVTNNKKQGVINKSGSVIIYLEYDQIGIDASKYSSNDIKNQYLLYDNCIPAKRDNKWIIFDKTGNKIVDEEYEDIGCNAGAGNGNSRSQTINANNVLLIPEYNGIVVKKGGLYGIINSEGKELIPIALKSVYSTTSSGQETYYMIYQNEVRNVIDYIKKFVNQQNTTTEDSSTNNAMTNNTVDTSAPANTNTNNLDNSQQTISNQESNTNTAVPVGANVVSEQNSQLTNNANVAQ